MFPAPERSGQAAVGHDADGRAAAHGPGDLTAHGFRSTFRDWAGETTAHPREVIEAALAHRLKDKAEAAYARGDLFEKRRKLMEDWASSLPSRRPWCCTWTSRPAPDHLAQCVARQAAAARDDASTLRGRNALRRTKSVAGAQLPAAARTFPRSSSPFAPQPNSPAGTAGRNCSYSRNPRR